MTAPTVVVLTHNEEKNLDACLRSVAGWSCGIVIVDSGSTDGTLEIAARFGARVYTNPFVNHVRQWQWALEQLPLDNSWVLALDADQRVTSELRDDLLRKLAAWDRDGSPVGAYVNRRQIFRGRWIRHGGYYPEVPAEAVPARPCLARRGRSRGPSLHRAGTDGNPPRRHRRRQPERGRHRHVDCQAQSIRGAAGARRGEPLVVTERASGAVPRHTR
ncbi:MAG: glycosyltransferase family 2 protein [Vicinamibacterales bacterium]